MQNYGSAVASYRDTGVVLRTYRLGEADRIVVIMTEGHGKVRAVAKGVRKARSKFGSRLEPGSHVHLQFHEGRNLDIVTQADSVESFQEIREDLDRLAASAVVLEAVDQLAQERSRDRRLYTMTVGALRTLRDRPGPAVVPAFLFRLLAADGVGLDLSVCMSCGDDVRLVAVDLAAGGGVCRSCHEGAALEPETMRLLTALSQGRVNEALAAPAGSATLELTAISVAAIERHVDRRLRAPQVAAG